MAEPAGSFRIEGHIDKISGHFDTLAIGVSADADINLIWLACEQPERPFDRNVMYHFVPDCHGCKVAKDAARRMGLLPA